MMNFEEWDSTIEKIENQIEKVNRQLAFRRLEIIGPRSMAGRSMRDSEEDTRKMDADRTIQELEYEKQILVNQVDYIKRTGELPPEIDDHANLSGQ